ncbi:MAG: RnfABCDGE type electron transport complex subunit B [Clostridia bacterium]|nr:RnfABCDGE type electron transport complex subunit B [Clostridia bacterium]
MQWTDILIPAAIFAGLGLLFGAALAIASRIFAVKEDERVAQITEALPGANCGGCGFSGCAAYAEAIVKGEVPLNACLAGGERAARVISEVMGVPVVANEPMRAQVMCSGKAGVAHKKYHYVGAVDCVAAERMGGGDKCCPNGCIGLGSCAAACPYDAITVKDGLAVVSAEKCRGCGVCVSNCPKHIIHMIPASATHWVACLSVENGKKTRKQCDAGCISCRLCEKACEYDAIHVDNFVAAIRYDKCVGCGRCADKCPRHIIHFVQK